MLHATRTAPAYPYKPSIQPGTADRKQRVIVTGGLGYIGSHVVISLLLTGKYIPIVLDNSHNAYPEAVKRVAQIARDEMGYVRCLETALICESGDARGHYCLLA